MSPRRCSVSCWTRRRTSSNAVDASFTTWNASSNGDGVGQLVTDRVGVATEPVEGGVLDGDLHVQALVLEPISVDRAGTALDGVQ